MDCELLLLPRDGFFCKDGRGWYTAGAGRAHGLGWPPLPTVRGALTGAVGRLEEAAAPLTTDQWRACAAQVTLGPSVAIRRPLGQPAHQAERLWPAPADALWQEGPPTATPLWPREAGVPTLGCEPDDPRREALWRPVVEDPSKPRPGPAWWIEADFAAWLGGDAVTWKDSQAWPDPGKRLETHVSINRATGTAADGMLFSHDVIETTVCRDGKAYAYGLACRAALPRDVTGGWLTLGGKSRFVTTEKAPANWSHPPDGLIAKLTGQHRLRLVVTTPAYFQRGWLPDGLDAGDEAYAGRLADGWPMMTLRAAYVGRPQNLSGWDMRAGHPKRTRRLVPAGSVYFVELSEPLGEEQAEALWLAQIGSDQADGLGVVVPGVWPEDEPRSQA